MDRLPQRRGIPASGPRLPGAADARLRDLLDGPRPTLPALPAAPGHGSRARGRRRRRPSPRGGDQRIAPRAQRAERLRLLCVRTAQPLPRATGSGHSRSSRRLRLVDSGAGRCRPSPAAGDSLRDRAVDRALCREPPRRRDHRTAVRRDDRGARTAPARSAGGGGAGRPPQEKRYRLPDPRHLAPRAAARAGGSPRCDRYPALERSRRFTSGPDRRRRDRHHGEPAGARTRRAPGEEGGPSQVDARPAQRRARESDRAGRRRDRSGAVAGRDRRGPGLAPDSERRPGRGRAVREDRVAGRHRPTRLADLVRRTSGAWRRRRRAAGRLRAKRGARRAAASRRRRGAERRAGRLRDPAELGVGALTGATARRDRVAALPRAPPRRLSAPSRRGGPRAPAVELALRRLSRGDRSGPA